MSSFFHRMLPLGALVMLAACGRGADASAAADTTAKQMASTAGARESDAAAAVRTASRPADACGWISAAEVAEVVGQLSGAPRPGDDGCLYPLATDTQTPRRRTQALEFQRKLEERFGKSDLPPMEADPSGVVVEVEPYTDPAGARGAGAAMAIMAGWLRDDSAGTGADSAARDTAPPKPLPGWDYSNDSTSRSFFGQIGQLRVAVKVHSAEVTRAQTVALATQIRDAIPDLPFPTKRKYNEASADPCSLVSVKEAEAVLGKLVVPPYRSDEGTPLAMAQGRSCAYYTTGHHALVVTPTWEYGGTAFEATRGIGGLLERVAPALHVDAADTLDTGPWDEAAGDPATGQLYFLKGDRMVEIGYLVSSTDFDGAVRLAHIAVGRL
jgi:hypothetical protein